MNDKNLPPLPEPYSRDDYGNVVWHDHDMRAYGLACVGAAQAQPVALTDDDIDHEINGEFVGDADEFSGDARVVTLREVRRVVKHFAAPEALAPDAEVRFEICKHCGHDMKEPCHHNSNPHKARNCHWNRESHRVLGTGLVNNRPDTLAARPVAPKTCHDLTPEQHGELTKQFDAADALEEMGWTFDGDQWQRPSEARAPLSDSQIDCIKQGPSQDYRAFARAIERAHGIPARVDSEWARDTLADIGAMQKLLNWNREQEQPPIRIGSEYAVAQAALSFASPARLQHGSEKK